MFHNWLAGAAGHFAAIAEDGKHQRMDEVAQGDARVGEIMQRLSALGIQELDLDVEVELLCPRLKNRHMIGLFDKYDGVRLEAERRLDAQLLDHLGRVLGRDREDIG